MREYLSILVPLVHGEDAQFAGETLSAHGSVNVADAPPCPILLAALAPRMLELAGAVADGTITWMTGPSTLAEHTIPSITKAARDAGRPAPRVCASLPVCVTDDADAARAHAAEEFSVYGMLPSYRAMLDREGAAGPADVAIVGDATTVRDAVKNLADIGVTDFAPALFGSRDEARATREVLAGLL
jgi:F420-dependent oxidoreductase-like protein